MSVHGIHADLPSIARQVEKSATAIDVQVSDDAVDRLARWNRKIDLTAARTIDELVDLCIADALVLARLIRCSQSVVRFDSGAETGVSVEGGKKWDHARSVEWSRVAILLARRSASV